MTPRLPSRSRRAFAPVFAAALLAGTAGSLGGHDFWLVPLGFNVAVGDNLTVLGQTSSAFPSSLSAVTPDRIASARVVDAQGEEAITDLAVSGNSLRLAHRPKSAGQKIVAVTIHPRSVRESGASFANYLVVEGAPEALERLRREGRVPTDSVTRRYAKYAKSLVTVGRGGAEAWAKPVGHPLEVVPVSATPPMAGGTMLVRLLYRGEPLRDATLHAGVVSMAGADELNARAGTEQHVALTTDAGGVASVPVRTAGLWNIRTIQIVEAARGSGADWDTHWATLVFEVKAAPR
jgi:hypothetical protein